MSDKGQVKNSKYPNGGSEFPEDPSIALQAIELVG